MCPCPALLLTDAMKTFQLGSLFQTVKSVSNGSRDKKEFGLFFFGFSGELPYPSMGSAVTKNPETFFLLIFFLRCVCSSFFAETPFVSHDKTFFFFFFLCHLSLLLLCLFFYYVFCTVKSVQHAFFFFCLASCTTDAIDNV